MRLFQTVRTKLSRPGPSNQIKARPGKADPTEKKCRAGPARVNRKILSLRPARPSPMGIKEKSMSALFWIRTGSFKPDARATEIREKLGYLPHITVITDITKFTVWSQCDSQCNMTEEGHIDIAKISLWHHVTSLSSSWSHNVTSQLRHYAIRTCFNIHMLLWLSTLSFSILLAFTLNKWNLLPCINLSPYIKHLL